MGWILPFRVLFQKFESSNFDLDKINAMQTSILYKVIIGVLFFNFYGSSLKAVTVTWNGGFGFWGQANRWSTGTVPGPDDYVIIQNGFVIMGQNFNATVKGVEISSNSAFRIEVNASLNLVNGDIDQSALTNNGILFNFGDISLDGFEGIDPNTAVGIVNNNHFRNFPAGSILIRNTNNRTIINNIDKTFINEGVIDIDVAYDIWAGCIYNLGVFQNKPGGIIQLVGSYLGISNPSLATLFENEGKIIIMDCTTSIRSSDFFHNKTSGSIQVLNGQVNNVDHLVNDGVMHISDIQGSDNAAIRNQSYFENYGTVVINNIEDIGIYNDIYSGSSPVIDNYGYIMVNSNSHKSIFNEGYLFNFNTGWIECDSYLKGGDYINFGVIKNTHQGIDHTIDLENSGIFNDKFGKLPSVGVSNSGLIVRPIHGPLIGGSYVYNAFDLANGNNFTLPGNWLTEIFPGNNAGIYDSSNNSFYPYRVAENDDELHANISINSSGLGGYFDIVVLEATNSVAAKVPDKTVAIVGEEVKVYPNPTQGKLTIELNDMPEASHEIFLYDALGQMVMRSPLEFISGQAQIDLKRYASQGVYYISITGQEGPVMYRKVIFSE